jgi:nucleoside-diphosphate-sugar epimerase
MNSSATQSALVTGASGFIGAHLVRRLNAGGWRVACMVRPTSRVDSLPGSAQLIIGDVCDRASIVRSIALSGAGVVFHLAGLVRAANAAAFLRANEEGSRAVAAACADRGTPPALVLVSSLAAAAGGRGGGEFAGHAVERGPPAHGEGATLPHLHTHQSSRDCE